MVNENSQGGNPITGICVVSDKQRCPPGYQVLDKAFDDRGVEADVWKDGFFSMSRIYRYICVCKTVPPNTFMCNVVADVTLTNDKDVVPSGYFPIELTADSNEKALRKKQLCVRSVARDTAVDAVCDVVLLARQKKPPNGYSLAGELDGLLVCFKYGVIPSTFPGGGVQQAAADPRGALYPMVGSQPQGAGLPYSIHPGQQQQQASAAVAADVNGLTIGRQTSLSKSGIDGVPFQLHVSLQAAVGNGPTILDLPTLREVSEARLDSEFAYPFRVEQTVFATS